MVDLALVHFHPVEKKQYHPLLTARGVLDSSCLESFGAAVVAYLEAYPVVHVAQCPFHLGLRPFLLQPADDTHP